MSRSGAVLVLSILSAACAVTPDRQDKTPPRLDLLIYYSAPSSPLDLTSSSGILTANKCIYVGPLFRVAVSARDPGGISFIKITDVPTGSPSLSLLAFKATPPPDQATQKNALGQTYSNPGTEPFNPNDVTVTYYYPDSDSGGHVHNAADLQVTYAFVAGAGDWAALLSVARNSSIHEVRSEINSYFLRLAGPQASQQPGKPCAVPKS